ncbi:MAG: tRNA uridine-5-carboxymethylaminomethyl(34) synthesis GTPase MnmE [Bacteroidaceae bacterium]
MQENDTICAISTATGGAIGIIRLSGNKSIEITAKIFQPKVGMPLKERKSHTLTFGTIYARNNRIVDEVLVSLFRAPTSYTGEESIEISCHGSQFILSQIIMLLIENGCRLARPGEYTQRAFLNGKMDLSQAEAVADVIASTSAATHRLAMNQMRGGFSKELQELRSKLLHITSLLELELDFSDHEELEFANREELESLIVQIEIELLRLTTSFNLGNVLKNGVPVAIIGETNVGKSTLLNALLGEEKAIVSDVHGTTRDVIEDTLNIAGTTFRFIDTAGIRKTTDEVETIGIDRTFQMMSKASILLWLIDVNYKTEDENELKQEIRNKHFDKKVIIVFNKSEHLNQEQRKSIASSYAEIDAKQLFISAKYKQNIEKLEEELIKSASIPTLNQDELIVTNARHYEALTNALTAILRAKEGLFTHLPTDLVSQDIRECIFHLSEISGHIASEDILQNIFRNFCIGK